MSGFLGVETPNAQAGLQNMILYPTPTRLSRFSKALTAAARRGSDPDRLGRRRHADLEDHPQRRRHAPDPLPPVRRAGAQPGRLGRHHPQADANELGWKDTVRISPLEDTIVALRPLLPKVPSSLGRPAQQHPPARPFHARGRVPGYHRGGGAGQHLRLQREAPACRWDGLQARWATPVDIINHYVNFGWEYVWHCHILSHEEMDMMHGKGRRW
jgi:hypothetical protein